MKRAFFPALALVVIFSGCGKKGAILPPVALIPQAPEILGLVQQGGQAVLEWKNPISYLDGGTLPGLASVEIWRAEMGTEEAAGPAALSREKFQERAALQAVIRQPEFINLRSGDDKQAGPLRASVSLGPDGLNHRILSYAYALRAIDSRRKKSPFSEIRSFRPKPLPRPPLNLRAEVEADGVVLSWDSPRENFEGSVLSGLAGYRVLRAEKGSPLKLLTAEPAPEAFFRDGQIVFGQTYLYAVRAAAAGSEPYDESSDSLPLEVTPRDTFPPAPPTGLTALPGEDFISLAWDRGPETDLAGYRVWRREEGGPEFRELTVKLQSETTSLDRTAEKNNRYEYVVTAEDRAGNRSPFSASVIESLKINR